MVIKGADKWNGVKRSGNEQRFNDQQVGRTASECWANFPKSTGLCKLFRRKSRKRRSPASIAVVLNSPDHWSSAPWKHWNISKAKTSVVREMPFITRLYSILSILKCPHSWGKKILSIMVVLLPNLLTRRHLYPINDSISVKGWSY